MRLLKNIQKKYNSSYFKDLPPLDFVNNKLLRCYSLNGLSDDRLITKNDINYQALYDLIPDISLYYTSFKIKQLFLNPNIKPTDNYKAISGFITLLKHFIGCYNYKIATYDKIVRKKKVIFYSIVKNNPINETIKINNDKILLSFD